VRAQRSQRRFATSIVGFASGGYDTFGTRLGYCSPQLRSCCRSGSSATRRWDY